MCRQVVDMGLNAGLCEHDGPPLPTGLRYWLPSFSLRAAPHWSSLGGALAAPHVGLDAHTVVIILEMRRRNVGRLSVCEFKTRSGPVSPWAPVGGVRDHRQALPHWAFCVGSPMELLRFWYLPLGFINLPQQHFCKERRCKICLQMRTLQSELSILAIKVAFIPFLGTALSLTCKPH